MSAAAARWALSQPLPPSSRLVLWALAEHADAEGRCSPSVKHIAKLCCMGERATRDALASLEQGNFIKKDARSGTVSAYLLVGHFTTPRRNAPRSAASKAQQTPAHSAAVAGQTPAHSAAVAGQTPAHSAAVATHARARTRVVPSDSRIEIKRDRKTLSPSIVAYPAQQGQAKPPYDPVFNAFYAAYPKHVGRADAFEAWVQVLRSGAEPHQIMRGLQDHQFNPEFRFIPHPSTWLRAHRWLDEQPADCYAAAPRKPRWQEQDERIRAMVEAMDG